MAKTKNSIAIQPIESLPEKSSSNFYKLPSSPMTELAVDIIGAGANIDDLPERKKYISRTRTYNVEEDTYNAQHKKVTLTTKKNASFSVEYDITTLAGNNKGVLKLLTFVLIKANEQVLHNGELSATDIISFPLQELIDCGLYQTLQSARRGFKDAMNALTDIKINGDDNSNPRQKISVVGLHPFRLGTIKNNQCSIQLEENLNWKIFSQYYTILPAYCFRLSNRAFELLHLIYVRARENIDKIKKTGSFNISMRYIQQALNLPDEDGNKNPQKTIKDPIENAIEEIEDFHSAYYNNTDFQLLLCYDENSNIVDYLKNGLLQVTMSGEQQQYFIKIGEKKEKLIESSQKKREQIDIQTSALLAAKTHTKKNTD